MTLRYRLSLLALASLALITVGCSASDDLTGSTDDIQSEAIDLTTTTSARQEAEESSAPSDSKATSASRSTSGQLRVSGNQLLDANMQPVRLNGVNITGTEYACIQGWGMQDAVINQAAIDTMLQWNINATRIPLNEHCWLAPPEISLNPSTTGQNYVDFITERVDNLCQAGMYVILDLHWSNGFGGKAEGQDEMANQQYSLAFWQSVASQFQSYECVLFDAYNEPHDITWECWRNGCMMSDGDQATGMQQIVDAIRAGGASQPVILTINGWGNGLSTLPGAWRDVVPVDLYNNLVAGVHIYNFTGCNSPSCWDTQLAGLLDQAPVLMTEVGDNSCGRAWIDGFLNWVDRVGTGMDGIIGWAWHSTADCGMPSLTQSATGPPTEQGEAFREYFTSIG